MVIAKIQVTGVQANVLERMPVPAGIVGGQVEFVFDSSWQSLRKTVVFAGAVVKDVLNAGDMVTVPAECVAVKNVRLRIGVYGTDEAGTLAIPTLWADCGIVNDAADPSGDESADPALPVWAQLQADVGDLTQLETQTKESLVKAINELVKRSGGTVDPAEVEKIVRDYMVENPPEPGPPGEPGKDGKDGQDGKPGEDGKDYVLTEADKAEIAEQAAELVEVPEGGCDNTFAVNIGEDGNNPGKTIADKTNEEIWKAYLEGKYIYAVMEVLGTNLNLMTVGNTSATFDGFFEQYRITYEINNDVVSGKMVELLTPESETMVQLAEYIVSEFEDVRDSIPDDEHINSLIDTKLGVIENGTY